MLVAYLDESGTHKGSKTLCVAGCVGNRKEWHSFVKEWRPKLVKAGVPYFHAKDPKCSSLKLPLALAIERHNLFGVICSVNLDIFNFNANVQFKSLLGNAYAVCTFMCAIEICRYAKANELGPISIIYEMGQPNADFIHKTLEAMSLKDNPRYDINSVTEGGKNNFVPLQTADFLSHIYNTNETKLFDYLCRSNKIRYTDIDSTALNEMSIEIKDAFRQRKLIRRRNKRNKDK